jgi:hypothetical protein
VEGTHVLPLQSRKPAVTQTQPQTSADVPRLLVPEQSVPQSDELLTVSELAVLLKCKPSSVFNLTRRRGAARYSNPIPVLRLPMGLRFRKSSILAWLDSQETRGAA